MSDTPFFAHNVRMTFRKNKVLRGLSLQLNRGETTVLIGENGAGKSTLMQLALGTLKAKSGTIELFGLDPIQEPIPIRQRVGFVPSVPDCYPWMTYRDLCKFLRPMYPTWDNDECERIAERLRVPRTTSVKEMSRGEGMKLMLTVALAPRPELLLLDEPFAGLDPLVREEVLAGVLVEFAERECTVLCATHDLDVAGRIADRIAVLASGVIRGEGSFEELFGEPMPARIPAKLKELLASEAQPDRELARC
jgi:ABC-2 type transport system ATP-binding protein